MSTLPMAPLGRTGLMVSRLGYGAMELRGVGHFPRLSPGEASTLLNAVLDSGINYIDTSPDYGYSEELIGRHLAHRRSEFHLATKCGCPDEPPVTPYEQRKPHAFTRKNIRTVVEKSLVRLKTSYLDVLQFHLSPARAVLERDESLDELRALQEEGKVRYIGISSTMPELQEHIAMNVFDVFQVPYSLLERQHEELIHAAARAGAGIVLRGGVSRGIMVKDEAVIEEYPALLRPSFRARRQLWREAARDDLLQGMSPVEFMLRFTLGNPDMSTTIVGTASPAHVADNARAAARGPLPPDMLAEARKRFERVQTA
jgi:aryl-alcohol dehydrogenase-like predicted oxidoreductase